MRHVLFKSICAGAFLTVGISAFGETIYDDFNNYNANALQLGNGETVGTQLTLKEADVSLTGFTMYYFTGATLSSNVGLDIQFLANNGPLANGYVTPGTVLYDNGLNNGIPASPTAFQGFSLTNTDLTADANVNLAPGFLFPTNFTVAISFTNLQSGDAVYLPVANNETNQIAISYGAYWDQPNGGSWSLLTNSVADNPLIQVYGVPEPSVFCLGAIGSALLLGFNRLKRKS